MNDGYNLVLNQLIAHERTLAKMAQTALVLRTRATMLVLANKMLEDIGLESKTVVVVHVPDVSLH